MKAGLQTDCTRGGYLGQFHLIKLKNIDWLAGRAASGKREGKFYLFVLAFLWAVAGHPFPGWGGNTKCIVVLLSTSHLFLIKEAAEQINLPSWYSSGQQVTVEQMNHGTGLEQR